MLRGRFCLLRIDRQIQLIAPAAGGLIIVVEKFNSTPAGRGIRQRLAMTLCPNPYRPPADISEDVGSYSSKVGKAAGPGAHITAVVVSGVVSGVVLLLLWIPGVLLMLYLNVMLVAPIDEDRRESLSLRASMCHFLFGVYLVPFGLTAMAAIADSGTHPSLWTGRLAVCAILAGWLSGYCLFAWFLQSRAASDRI